MERQPGHSGSLGGTQHQPRHARERGGADIAIHCRPRLRLPVVDLRLSADTEEHPLEGAYTASGAFGQYITVVPRLDMVVPQDRGASARNVTNEAYFGTILPQVITLVDPRR